MSTDKICPIMQPPTVAPGQWYSGPSKYNCVGDKCGWWVIYDNGTGDCAVVAIAYNLVDYR